MRFPAAFPSRISSAVSDHEFREHSHNDVSRADATGRQDTAGKQHRQIDRDPTRVMTGLPRPQPSESIAERRRQARGIGDVRQQTGTGTRNTTPTISTDNDLRT